MTGVKTNKRILTFVSLVITLVLVMAVVNATPTRIVDKQLGTKIFGNPLECNLHPSEFKDYYPIGCNCQTSTPSDPNYLEFSRSNYSLFGGRTEDLYCFNDGREQEMRMCTTDGEEAYMSQSELDALGLGQGHYLGPRHNECNLYTPFCAGNICHECLDHADCAVGPNEISGVHDAKCWPGTYSYGSLIRNEKSCHYCRKIEGSGDTKIDFLFVNTPIDFDPLSSAQGMVNAITSIEPFNELNNQNKFSFSVVDGPYRTFVPEIDWDEELMLINWLIIEDSVEDEIDAYFTSVCDDSDVKIVIDLQWPTTGGWNDGYYNEKRDTIYSESDAMMITHELGHQLCKLEDEYPVFKRPSEWTRSINLEEGDCSTFNDLGIDEINCMNIKGINFDGRFFYERMKKSTEDSMMNTLDVYPRFNIIGCAGCLNKIGGTPIQTAVNQCKAWSCEDTPPIIIQSRQEC